MMDVPPQQLYNSQEDLALDLAIYAAIGSYKFIIRRSRSFWHGSERPTILYACNRWHQGCQFSILSKEDSYGLWHLKHRTEAGFSYHNHGPQQPREPEPLEKKLLTCSKCHIEGHRRGAKSCILRSQDSS